MTSLLEQLQSYQPIDPVEAAHVERTIAFLRQTARPFVRETLAGHVTASAIVVNPDRSAILLLHHRKLDAWLQPGGHCDGETDTLAAALRELREETGLIAAAPVAKAVFDVDVHRIPTRKDVPEHWHYDIRYLLVANEQDPLQPSAREAIDLRWFPLSQLAQVSTDASLRRVAQKLGVRSR